MPVSLVQKCDTETTPTMTNETILATARHVLTAEGDALHKLAAQLNEHLTQAVHAIVACKGRVIVTGMGKSGHIARKIAATMASTGTPAYFVHPGEASHGDMGMITAEDVVIAISNSGEVQELADVITYTRRFSIPLIGITSRAQSTLATASDIVLLLANEPEVGSLGLAPTTSTTMTLALGDALAIACLDMKGFTAEDFRNFHPGGKLGKNLVRVADLMHGGDDLPLAHLQDKMADVLLIMTQKSFGCAIIVDDNGKLQGIITDGDLRRHMATDLMDQKAEAIMTRKASSVSPRLLAAEAVMILNEKKVTQLLVVEDEKPLGIVHIHDLLRAGIA